MSEQLQPSTAAQKPTGKVVGIIKRNWRPFCGMLNVSQIKEVGVNRSTTPPFVRCHVTGIQSAVPQMLYQPVSLFHLIMFAVSVSWRPSGRSTDLFFAPSSVDQAPLHPRRPPHPSNPHRNPPGIGPGRSEDHGGHRRLAQTLQIPKCELEVHHAVIAGLSRRRVRITLVLAS